MHTPTHNAVNVKKAYGDLERAKMHGTSSEIKDAKAKVGRFEELLHIERVSRKRGRGVFCRLRNNIKGTPVSD